MYDRLRVDLSELSIVAAGVRLGGGLGVSASDDGPGLGSRGRRRLGLASDQMTVDGGVVGGSWLAGWYSEGEVTVWRRGG